jgi:DNA gyrase subunit B
MHRISSDLLRQIRQRPGMYVGDTGGYGLHRLPLLLLQAGAIAASEGRGDEVGLYLEDGGVCTFAFNGPLWPSGLVPEPSGDSLSRLLTLADADPLAPRPEGAPETFLLVSPYEDLAIVYALSSELEVTVGSEGQAWLQTFRCGEPAVPPREAPASEGALSPFRGTRIRFVPDPSIFERARLSLLGLFWRMEELAALHECVTFHLRDDMRLFEAHHRFARGLVDYAARLSVPALPLHEPWGFEGHHGTTRIRVSLQWCEAPGSRAMSWVNQLRAHGGTHLKGLAQGLHGALYHYAEAVGRTPEFSAYIPAVLMDGLTVLLDVTVPRPVWLGPVKGELANEDCEFDVAELVQAWLRQRFEEEPAVAARVLDHVIARYIARG